MQLIKRLYVQRSSRIDSKQNNPLEHQREDGEAGQTLLNVRTARESDGMQRLVLCSHFYKGKEVLKLLLI